MAVAKGIGELALIERIRAGARSRNSAVKLGIGDDCAVLRVPAGHEMVVTTDFCLEGKHFRRDWHSPQSAGHRCLARGLSDVAGMGGRPIAAFLSLALPKGFDLAWLDGFMEGFGSLAERFGVELAGGDTSEAPGEGVLADVMVVGAIKQGKALGRRTATLGDGIYCSGSLGGSAVELAAMASRTHPTPASRARSPGATRRKGAMNGAQSFPEPRVLVGRKLVGLATSCMDLSDGLSTDLMHLCAHAEIESAAIPLAEGATLAQALNGGEDYELLFTAPGRVPEKIAGITMTRVGVVTGSGGLRMDGRELKAGGWEHHRG
jgi:thiamine-monophosphate kinase